ncbi:MAG: hypothetical protein LBP67_10625 [Bacteroidales bacterium]|jgi:predicted secreted protein|nr:hypothetical protein [Bacteroidales bacterium]
MEKILFEEKQYFRQWWLILLFVLIVGIFLYGIVKQVILGIPFGNNPMHNYGLILVTTIMIIVCLAIFFMNLETKITNIGIYVKFSPLVLNYKFFSWNDVAKWEIIKYHPVRDYGGWGIRGTKKNRVYNVFGKYGLYLIFKNGDTMLVGTNEPDKLKKQLETKN